MDNTTTNNTNSSHLHNLKRHLFTLIFCIPTSLFALLLLLLLSFNGVSIFYLEIPFSPSESHTFSSDKEIPFKRSSSSIMYSIKEEIPLSQPLLQKPHSLNSSSSFTVLYSLKEETPPSLSNTQLQLPLLQKSHSLNSSVSSTVTSSLKEEIPLSSSNTNTQLPLLEKSDSMNSSSFHKPKWTSKNKHLLKLMQSSALSRRFPGRAKEFFNGYGSNLFHSSCKVRFFMTWISSLESFRYRELLTVESVFKSHPNACLLIISTSLDSRRGAILLRPFKDRGFRVMAISPDFRAIFRSTPAEPWFDRLRKGDVDPGKVPLGQNLSNLLRLAVLYKFGGIYIDTDFVVLKKLTNLRNVIGAQTLDIETGNWSRLNNAVMIFDKKHPLLFKFMEEFALTFNGNKWGHNGPYLVSRVVLRVIGRPGFNFTVLPPMAFYPVDWNRIQGLFHAPRDGVHLQWMSSKLRHIRNKCYGVHLWNKQSRKLKVEDGSIISHLMLDSCVFCHSGISAL